MVNGDYEYIPLSSKLLSTRTRSFRLTIFSLVLSAALLASNIVLYLKTRSPRGVYDNYEHLNEIPVTHAISPGAGLAEYHTEHHERAVVTTLYTESYINGVLTLAHTLRAVNTTSRFILLYIPGRLSPSALCRLSSVGWELRQVPRIEPPDNGRGVFHRFLDQYTKLHIWGLDSIGIKSAVYLDGDTIALRNFDELWDLPFNFAAVPDMYGDKRGFTLSFNAGVLFLRPSTDILNDMLLKIGTADYSHKDAEQGFLNHYFGQQVVRLPYVYNGNLAIKRLNPSFWEGMRKELRIVHYTLVKPFPELPSEIPSERELKQLATLEEKKKEDDGFWADEIRWWEDAWTSLTLEQRQFVC